MEKVLRLSEQELNFLEASVRFVKKDTEEYLEASSKRPPVIDSKYVDENGDTIYESVYKSVLEQANSMLEKIKGTK